MNAKRRYRRRRRARARARKYARFCQALSDYSDAFRDALSDKAWHASFSGPSLSPIHLTDS
jgi:hypothetical protein